MSGMKITIAYITAREDPRLDWFVDGLAQQATKHDQIELIVVDALGRPATSIGFRPIPQITKLVQTRPKPTAWQGPHRITAHDFFANANARNTAIVLCSTDYICFVDDRCKIDRGWLDQVRRNERKRESVICGPYDKHEDWGISIDHGGNHALPLKWALEVNGFEEGCDPVGLEDCVFGHMLANAGRRIDFVTEMSIQQDRRGFVHPLDFPRQDKGQSPNDKSHAIRARFFGRKRTAFTPDLRVLRGQHARGQPFPVPSGNLRDWYDGSPIRGVGITTAEREARARGVGEASISGANRSDAHAAGSTTPMPKPIEVLVSAADGDIRVAEPSETPLVEMEKGSEDEIA